MAELTFELTCIFKFPIYLINKSFTGSYVNQAGGVMLNSQLEQEDIKEIQKIQPRSVIYIELVLCHFVMASAESLLTGQ